MRPVDKRHCCSRDLAPAVLLGNLLFLQTKITQEFGSNGPLWSLFSEFWYYVLVPRLDDEFLMRTAAGAGGSGLTSASGGLRGPDSGLLA